MSKPEVRLNDDKTLDEVVATRAHFHLEQMDDNLWWLAVEGCGERVVVWLQARGKITASFETEPR